MKKFLCAFFLLFLFSGRASAGNYAIIDGSGNVANVIVWDGVTALNLPAGSTTVALSAGSCAYPGGTYSGGTFSCSPATTVTSPPWTAPTGSGCSATNISINQTGPTVIMGSFTAGVTGPCNFTVTANSMSSNIKTMWVCVANDLTTPKAQINQITPYSTTGAVVSGSTTAGDIINLICPGF